MIDCFYLKAKAKTALAEYKAFIEVLLRTEGIMKYPKVTREFLELPSADVCPLPLC